MDNNPVENDSRKDFTNDTKERVVTDDFLAFILEEMLEGPNQPSR